MWDITVPGAKTRVQKTWNQEERREEGKHIISTWRSPKMIATYAENGARERRAKDQWSKARANRQLSTGCILRITLYSVPGKSKAVAETGPTSTGRIVRFPVKKKGYTLSLFPIILDWAFNKAKRRPVLPFSSISLLFFLGTTVIMCMCANRYETLLSEGREEARQEQEAREKQNMSVSVHILEKPGCRVEAKCLC